jgi:hypothetical protein
VAFGIIFVINVVSLLLRVVFLGPFLEISQNRECDELFEREGDIDLARMGCKPTYVRHVDTGCHTSVLFPI